MNWSFTPDEFIHIWGDVKLPFPLSAISSVTTKAEFEVLDREIDIRIPVDDALSAALRLVSKPEVTVAVFGEHGDEQIRTVGAVAGRSATVLDQQPGSSSEFGGDVFVRSCPAGAVPRHLFATLAQRPAGNTPPMTEPTRQVCYGESSGIRDLLLARRAGTGHIAVTPAEHAPRYVSWIDVEDDGRYLIREAGSDVQLEPCSYATLLGAVAAATNPPAPAATRPASTARSSTAPATG